jgi:hypothetical protein
MVEGECLVLVKCPATSIPSARAVKIFMWSQQKHHGYGLVGGLLTSQSRPSQAHYIIIIFFLSNKPTTLLLLLLLFALRKPLQNLACMVVSEFINVVCKQSRHAIATTSWQWHRHFFN